MKKYKYRHFKGLLCILIAILVLTAGTDKIFAKDDHTVLKVGFFEFDGYHNMDEDGGRSGYGYEFIQKMLRYNNYTAEYVGYENNWSEMQDMLENGQIDILTSAQKTPEREEKFDFSEQIGTSAAILTVKAGNYRFSAGEYSTYNGIRVGVIEGNSRNDRFVELAKKKGFSYKLVYYDDMTKLTDDLQKGDRIDAIVSSNLRVVKNEWILDKFATAPFYAMVKKGNTEILNKINYAIDQMNSNSVGWQDELFSEYYSGTSGESIALSSTEREYLETLKTSGKKISVLVHPDRAPYCYVENGQAKGIITDIFSEIANRLEIPYEYIITGSREEYVKIKNNKKADIILEARDDLSRFEDLGYKLTDPVMNIAYATVEKTDFSGEVKRVATINESYSSDKNLINLLADKEIKYYSNLKECVDAVLSGAVDTCYMYDYSGQKFASENVKGQLQSTTIPDVEDKLTLAVRASDDYRLLAIVSKGVLSVKQDYVNTAIKQNTDFSIGNLSVIEIAWRNPIIVVIFVGLAALVFILVFYGIMKKKNENRVLKKNTELERFIGYVCKSNSAVTEVNYTDRTANSYNLVDGHIVRQKEDFKIFDENSLKENVFENDFENIDSNILSNNVKKIIDSGEEQYFECRFKEKEDYKWYSVTMSPIPRDYDHPNNIIIFKRDIDEAKKKEENARESLREALEAANQASESKGSFLSNMSHEIRTPLNAIIGYLSLAKEKEVSQEIMEKYIDNCEIASKHLLQIINDILDMSSIESGKLQIAHEEFDLKNEISDITTIFFQNSKLKGINFETHVNELTEEWVIGDQLRLNQVLMNLLSNAVKFTPENGLVQLVINQVREDDDRVFIQFIVKDNGIGMSSEYMSRIFHPFEQENAGTAKKFGGSGLGLSITYNLVKMMGGTIKVESKQNEGTSFTVTMYFGKSKISHDNQNASADYSHVRVLVIDDKEDECAYIKTMLKRCGVKADCATSGKKALRRIRSRMDGDFSYNMCIIDWNMPEMDGCEVTRRIREEISEDVPVIIATAYDITEFQDDAKAAGANKIISKPLFQSTLFDILVSTFGKYNPEADLVSGKERIDMSGIHLLLAEDNPMNMDIAVTMLERAGIAVDQAMNGEEAYKLFCSKGEGTYDLVLMDVQMPVMDGYEATKAIRNSNHPEGKTIPIVAMTANAFAEDVTEAISNGMNAHIAKPINYDKLFDILNKYCK